MKISSPAAVIQIPYIQRSLKGERKKVEISSERSQTKTEPGAISLVCSSSKPYIGSLADVLVESDEGHRRNRGCFQELSGLSQSWEHTRGLGPVCPGCKLILLSSPPQARECQNSSRSEFKRGSRR
jgi:hypothetical protein